DPVVIPTSPWVAVMPFANCVMLPLVEIRPIWFARFSVNQRLPSGPSVIALGPLFAVGIVNSVMVPAGVIRPTLLALYSVYQTLPSGADVMPAGPLEGVGMGNSVMRRADPEMVTAAVPLTVPLLARTVADPVPLAGAVYRPLLLIVPRPPVATDQVRVGG